MSQCDRCRMEIPAYLSVTFLALFGVFLNAMLKANGRKQG